MFAPLKPATGEASPIGTFSRRTSMVLPLPSLPTDHVRHSDVAVVTWVAGETAYRWFSVTGPAMKHYAERVGADLVVLDGYGGQPYVLANKFRIKGVLEQYGYSAVLYVDADALVTDDCIDFFSAVPSGHAAILDEADLLDDWAMACYRREALTLLESQGMPTCYESLPSPKNTGLYLLRAEHAEVLAPPAQPFPLCYRDGATVEQTWTSLMLDAHDVPVWPLENPRHHWLWYADQEEWHTEGAMVLHFAGLRNQGDRRYRRLLDHATRVRPAATEGGAVAPSVGAGRLPAAPIPEFDRQMMLDAPAPPALRLVGRHTIDVHRSGWQVALKSLSVLSHDSGVLFDGFIENTFLWHGTSSREAKLIPYTEPWLGFIHNPPAVPDWPSISESRIQRLLRDPAWRESLDYCLGLFALSDHLAQWVRARFKMPCEVVRYPTLAPKLTFSLDAFAAESEPVVTTIGFWLRRFSSFEALEAPGFRKLRPLLLPADNAEGVRRTQAYDHDERVASGRLDIGAHPVEVVPRLTDEDFDLLLSRSVVFLDLIDASAVTAIVECMARATPVLVNPLPAVVEYLGTDYPMYFSSLEEAAKKLADPGIVAAAHQHMVESPMRAQLTPQAFLDAVAASGTYQRALQVMATRGS